MKFSYLLTGAFSLAAFATKAQTPNVVQPYSFDFYRQLDRAVYDKDTRVHSALKPYFTDDSLIGPAADSARYFHVSRRKSGFARKLLDEHLIAVKDDDYNVYLDPLIDGGFGKETVEDKMTWRRVFGLQGGGTIGKKFSFYAGLVTGSAVFAKYYQDYSDSTLVVPGQSFDRNLGHQAEKNWTNVSSWVSWAPSKHLNITAGQGKTFIGDGYRSMILSDFSSNYPFLRFTVSLGRIQYLSMWISSKDPGGNELSYDSGYRKKGAVFHYLDWNVSNRLSLGFFDAIVWSQYDDLGIHRAFDWSYANPLIFFRSVEEMNGSPDNVITGFNGKFELTRSLTLYGQLLLDEFTPAQFFRNDGWWANKFGIQAGLKTHDTFGVAGLGFLTEFNTASPYTYAERYRGINYSNYNEPLAHPFGANFREALAILTWSGKRWQFFAESDIAAYGKDPAGTASYGKDIFKSYNDRIGNYGNKFLQGIKTDYRYYEGQLSYTINPVTNLKILLNGAIRTENNASGNSRANWFTVGLRSGFGNLYRDF